MNFMNNDDNKEKNKTKIGDTMEFKSKKFVCTEIQNGEKPGDVKVIWKEKKD